MAVAAVPVVVEDVEAVVELAGAGAEEVADAEEQKSLSSLTGTRVSLSLAERRTFSSPKTLFLERVSTAKSVLRSRWAVFVVLRCLFPRKLTHDWFWEQNADGTKTEYRVWNPFRSKLAAGILGGLDSIWIKPGDKVLYLGAASGTSVSHVADIVGPTGLVYAVEFSHRSGRDLINVAKKRTNVIPIIEDARHPQKYRMLVGMVDTVFADVAQPDQARIIAMNSHMFLKQGGHIVISIKVRKGGAQRDERTRSEPNELIPSLPRRPTVSTLPLKLPSSLLARSRSCKKRKSNPGNNSRSSRTRGTTRWLWASTGRRRRRRRTSKKGRRDFFERREAWSRRNTFPFVHVQICDDCEHVIFLRTRCRQIEAGQDMKRSILGLPTTLKSLVMGSRPSSTSALSPRESELASEIAQLDKAIASRPTPSLLVHRGMARFRLAQIDGSIEDFDAAGAQGYPIPRLWQRGLSLYYAGKFLEGAEQFRVDLQVNAHDAGEFGLNSGK